MVVEEVVAKSEDGRERKKENIEKKRFYVTLSRFLQVDLSIPPVSLSLSPALIPAFFFA